MSNRELFSRRNPPPSIERAAERKSKLITLLQKLEGDLSGKGSGSPGKGFWGEELLRWRQSVVAAKRHVERELRFLNDWIKQKRISETAKTAGVDPSDPRSMIAAAQSAIWAIAKRGGIELLPEEKDLATALQHYLHHK